MKMTSTQRSALFIAITTSFMGPFLISSVNVALPTIEKAMQLSSSELGWIINAFLLSSAVFLLPAGKIADNWGQVRTYRTGIVVFAVSSLLCGLATSGIALIVFRVLQGVGAAMTTTTGAAILVSLFPPNLRGRVLGINVASVYLGLSMGPFIGGILTQQWGWHSIFFVSAPLGAVAAFLAFRWMKNNTMAQSSNGFDYIGSLLYGGFLIAFVYGASHLPNLFSWLVLGLSFILFPLFVISQKNSANPLFKIELFTQNKLFAFSNLAALINYSATFAVVFLVSLYLQKIKLMSPSQAGTLLVVQPIVQVLVSPVAGILSDKMGARGLASAGMLLISIGLFVFSTLTPYTSNYLIIGLLVVMGIGFGLFSSPNINTIMGSVTPQLLGVASGTAATMRIIGQMVSMTITALLFSIIFGNTPVNEVDNTLFLKAVNYGFITLGTLCVLGIWFSIFRGTNKNADR
ncbi:MAG: MFS transporter [Breznakibacter sp.]